jgi:hypothetical protein
MMIVGLARIPSLEVALDCMAPPNLLVLGRFRQE